MGQIDDLKKAVARVETANSAELKAISDKLSSIGADNPEITSLVGRLNSVAEAMEQEAATLEPPVTPTV